VFTVQTKNTHLFRVIVAYLE